MNQINSRRLRPHDPWARAAVVVLSTVVTATALTGGWGLRDTLSAAAQPETRTAQTGAPAVAPLPASAARAGAPALPVQPPSYSGVVDLVAPSVVTIRVQRRAEVANTSMPAPFRDYFGNRGGAPERRREGGLGSGVVVRADGLILTNHHVVDGAGTIRVDLADGRSLAATLVGSDPPSDLAVLRVPAAGLPALPFGNSDRMKVGDVVLAFGNPLGVGPTVTMGIVSAKGRATGVSDGSYEDFLQTDAPINQGNSGGALVNLQGELVGINAQIVSPSGGNIGLGFAIPSSMAMAVTEQLARDGVVRRAKLGVTVQGLTPELAESLGVSDARGALVSAVEPGGPADRAGVKQGDLVVEVDGKPVADANAMRNQIAGTGPGNMVPMVLRRNGRTETVTARLAERERPAGDTPEASGAEQGEASFGMALTALTPQLAVELELPRTASGLVVTGLDPSGLAASAGMQSGDVIKSVNGQAVTSVASLRSALAAKSDRPALVLVTRRGADAFVALPRAHS